MNAPDPDLRPDFTKQDGLVAAIAQCSTTKELLMLAWMNEEAYNETVRTGKAVYYSRSRKRLWRKGEESGNQQIVHEMRIDCDRDAVLLFVEQVGGAACHEGFSSCFFRRVTESGTSHEVVGERLFDPKTVYQK